MEAYHKLVEMIKNIKTKMTDKEIQVLKIYFSNDIFRDDQLINLIKEY
jgi:hypothetical protein